MSPHVWGKENREPGTEKPGTKKCEGKRWIHTETVLTSRLDLKIIRNKIWEPKTGKSQCYV